MFVVEIITVDTFVNTVSRDVAAMIAVMTICGAADIIILFLLSNSRLKNLIEGGLAQIKISHFKIPRYIMFVKEFPKTVSGKIKKFEMV
ncbi:hypothetical protein CEXT_36311 [Caerostris extrusa]|uniref:AMP-binding enzyme C-terminal domain-containing protein n=1 Tax=Caerostris extrusa TaxID=172846 RepID=A0AAV4T551_CAEEX|nr:hypothetical protein CEXT_36311 [Caerostris extrusa]